MVVDATGQKIDKAAWRYRWERLLRTCPDPFLEMDATGIVLEWNPGAERAFGWERAEVVGRPGTDTFLPMGIRPWDVTVGPRPFEVVHRAGRAVRVEAHLFSTSGRPGSSVAGFVRLREEAGGTGPPGLSRDLLTGLPDRAHFVVRTADAVDRGGPVPGSVAVVLLDLDRFKSVNNSMGHDVGDLLLVSVAARLTEVAGDADLVARFGGDEFLALFEAPAGAARARADAFIERVRGALAAPFVLGGTEVFVDASMGIALNTFGVDDTAELLSNAEAAMYRAKCRGGSSVETFGESMRIEVLDRMTTEHSLHRALERRELTVHYQPVVEIDGVTTTGVEALVRWQHPVQGMVSPYRFIPVAEESGLIIPIGAWVLEQACHQLSDWHQRERTGPHGSIEVNLSARQIDDTRIVHTVEEILDRTGLPPQHLTLEITESALMKDAASALGVLRALKSLGVLLAIDDFGTGYSSLSYLQRFPLDILKVDRSFVEGLGTSPEGEAIVSAVITLAHALGLQVVAEGVETTRQLEVLRAFGCDLAQGYLFSRPLPASEIAASFGLAVGA